MLLVIDNYDSFVYNLARYMALAGWQQRIIRNDEITLEQAIKLSPTAIVISPGPCTPKEAGISVDLIRALGPTTPILGVCLGHQCIGEAYGAKTIRAPKPQHGQSSEIFHNYSSLFRDVPNPTQVGRYHSLVTQLENNEDLIITAETNEGLPMALQHKTHPVYGLQFHPESILTEHGQQIAYNFTDLALSWHERHNPSSSNKTDEEQQAA